MSDNPMGEPPMNAPLPSPEETDFGFRTVGLHDKKPMVRRRPTRLRGALQGGFYLSSRGP